MTVETGLSKERKKIKPLREKVKRMHLSNKRVKRSFVNIVQKRAMKRKNVGNYILKKDPSLTKTRERRNMQLLKLHHKI